MRNLKRVLALAMALVMMLGMMITANAASYADEAAIAPEYEEAVEVLSGMGIFQGTGAGFNPKGELTRAEAATLIYRVISADVGNKKVDLYDYSSFDDVKAGEWYTGYVTYAANGNYIVGDGTGKFNPNDKVTGVQVLKIMLRAMGYGAKGEFEGAAWSDNVLTVADDLGLLDNVNVNSLNIPASREIVAQLIFDAIQAPTTTYTPAFGYVDEWNLLTNNASLGWKNFGLKSAASADKWGRPATVWYDADKGQTKGLYATIEEEALATYYTAVAECQVATDVDDGKYALYVNGANISSLQIDALDTVDTIGAQGRLTQVYEDRIVMIDTFLAKVTAVADATYDVAGHLKTPAKITMTVYDGSDTVCYQTNGATNYNYKPGDMILVNAYTAAGDRDDATTISKAWNGEATYLEIAGLSEAMVGTQTLIWYNIGKHTVNGTTYIDAAEFNHDEALYSTANYTWYFDQYGNIIGNVEVATNYNYAVVKNMWWAGDPATGAGKAMATLLYMDGTENVVSVASIDLNSGTAKTITPTYSIDVNDVMTGGEGAGKLYVATYAATNAANDTTHDIIDGHLFKVATLADGSVTLAKVWEKAAATATTAAVDRHSELATNVSIVSKYGWITATEKNIRIDTTTQFLVGTKNPVTGAYSYKTCTGLNEISDFKAVTKVDYVLGRDGVADYVYIIGVTADATAHDFVLITNNAYSAVLKNFGGVNYYELTLPVPAEDGSVVTIKIEASDANCAAHIAELTSITSVGKLFYLEYTNGFVTEVTEIDNINNGLTGLTGKDAVKLTDAKMSNGVLEATVIGVAGCRFNVTSATEVVGTLSADMTNKVVYVIYQTTNAGPNVANFVEKVYVLEYPDVAGSASVTKITNVTVSAAAGSTLSYNYMDKTPYAADFDVAAADITYDKSGSTAVVDVANVAYYLFNNTTGEYDIPFTGTYLVTGNYIQVITLEIDSVVAGSAQNVVFGTGANVIVTPFTVAAP